MSVIFNISGYDYINFLGFKCTEILYTVLKIRESRGYCIFYCLSKLGIILKVDDHTIKNAITSGFPDFEDSIQYFCALESKKIDVIITRNIKDYRHSELPVMSPGDFLKTMSR